VVTTMTKSSAVRSRIFPKIPSRSSQIATARFTAEVGRSGNGIINIVTKSGTNQYHGSLFDYERNRNLQAQPATVESGLPKAPFDREQFGGSIGGPFKANKAWWFASAEYRNQNAAIETGERDFATGLIVNTYAPAPLRDALFSTRADYQLDSTNTLMARYSFNREELMTNLFPRSATVLTVDHAALRSDRYMHRRELNPAYFRIYS
jgi:hypothetical protein